MDRGYPSFALFSSLLDHGNDFVVRMIESCAGVSSAVRTFLRSGRTDAIVKITAPSGKKGSPIRVRLVRTRAADGTQMLLATSLRRREVSAASLRALYALRWESEEFFKQFKSLYASPMQLRSRTVEGVHQELFAIALLHALGRYAMVDASNGVEISHDEMSPKSAICGLSDNLVLLLREGDRRTLAAAWL